VRIVRLETRRLVIRSFASSDAPDYAALVADPEVMQYIGDGSAVDAAQAKAYVENCVENERTLGFARYVLELRNTNNFIGICGFALIDGYVDFGYRIARKYWGNGYVNEAAPALIRYGFERLGFESIVAIAYSENQRSIRVMEKLGFEYERPDTLNGHRVVRYSLRDPTFSRAKSR
jgi:RimJ/RimL family protein N-acetyltransferase